MKNGDGYVITTTNSATIIRERRQNDFTHFVQLLTSAFSLPTTPIGSDNTSSICIERGNFSRLATSAWLNRGVKLSLDSDMDEHYKKIGALSHPDGRYDRSAQMCVGIHLQHRQVVAEWVSPHESVVQLSDHHHVHSSVSLGCLGLHWSRLLRRMRRRNSSGTTNNIDSNPCPKFGSIFFNHWTQMVIAHAFNHWTRRVITLLTKVKEAFVPKCDPRPSTLMAW
ncbi:Hypothetical predicted protein [Prunus dulcis]|uniref:Uncharacterized protein n=1 Tax=Prunus dulcis TaxID=3755 RepID=A0A5E4G5B3_PRUDU|nr:Hypothetical predicted protein [Prunus dulcis]